MYLKEFRKKKHLTQAELAEKIGVHENTLRRWENEDFESRASELKELCAILNITEDELLNGPKDKIWTLKIKLSTELNKEEVIDMTSNNCISNLNLTPNGAALTMSADYSVFEDEAKLEDFFNQIREARALIVKTGREMLELNKSKFRGNVK